MSSKHDMHLTCHGSNEDNILDLFAEVFPRAPDVTCITSSSVYCCLPTINHMPLFYFFRTESLVSVCKCPISSTKNNTHNMPVDEERTVIPDVPRGPLCDYRSKAQFNWKDFRLVLEDKELVKIKVSCKEMHTILPPSPH